MNKELVKLFVDKVYSDLAGAMSVGMAYVGVTTGLFRAMAGSGPVRSEEVVARSGLQARYVEEWLKGMTTAGYLQYDAAAQTFELPAEHSYLLTSEGTDHFVGGLFQFAPVAMRVAPRVAEAFRNGGGVRFEEFGSDCIHALDGMNGGQYEQRLGAYWLTKLPDVMARLENGGRVLDVGCGVGRAAITIARTFPRCEVIGLDPDGESIRQAREAAAAAGLGDRVRFVAKTTSEYESAEGFDLITACDCVHDFSAPQRTLAEMHSLLNAEGVLFIVEPKAADRLEDNINALGTVYYGFSIFHCMTQSLARGGPGLGTCMGPATAEKLLRQAGFRTFRVLEVKSQVNLFYAATP